MATCVNIEFGGREFRVRKLTISEARQLDEVEDLFGRAGKIDLAAAKGTGLGAALHVMAEMIHAILVREHKDLTVEALEEILPMEDADDICTKVLTLAGVKKRAAGESAGR